MDANAIAFWPKLGQRCEYYRGNDNELFIVIDILNEIPCKRYLIQSLTTGQVMKAFRHEIFRPEKTQMEQTTFSENEPEFNTDSLFEPWDEDRVEKLSDLDENDLDDLDMEAKPKSTKQSESWAINRLLEWQMKRNFSINLNEISEDNLATTLRKFYAEVRTRDGKLLAPSSLRGIRAGIHRTLTSPPYNRKINILEGATFMYANKMLENMCKKYISTPSITSKLTHTPAIEEGDMIKIAKYLKSYQSTPTNLLDAFWFCICYFFARRGREGFRNMTKSSFQVKNDDSGKEYLVMCKNEKTKNWQGGCSSKAWDYSDIRAYSFDVGVEHVNCVDLFRFYCSRLNPEIDALFQRPKQRVSENDTCWFQKSVVGKNKLGEIMKSISKSAGLSQIYTNHSVRATAITVMYQGGIDTKQICKITKHKNEESLKHYIDGQSSAQKRKCSEVLSKGFTTSHNSTKDLTESNTSTSSFSASSNNTTFNQVSGFDMPFNVGPQNFHFNVSGGNCHFHFHYQSASNGKCD